MPLEFTLIDVGKITAAFFLWPLILILPGYGLARALDVAHFRRRPSWQRLLMALLLSISVMPVVAYLTGRIAGMPGALTVTLLCSFASAAFLYRDGFEWRSTPWKPFACYCAVWWVIIIFSLADLQIGHRLYPSTVSFDLSFRSMLVEQFAQFPNLPGNPAFFDGQPAGLRYHYFWFVYCALLERMTFGWLPGRLILAASSLWLAAAIGWLLILFVRYFQPARAGKGKRASIAMALAFVGGLDVLGAGLLYAMGWMHRLPPTLEWWNPQQITAWVDQFLWISNHVAALVACLTAILLLTTDIVPSGRRTAGAVAAGICLGSAAGLSVYVAFTTVVFLGIWGLSLVAKRKWSRFTALAVSGGAALLIVLPYLTELLSSSGEGSRGSQFAVVAVRPFLLWRTAILSAAPDVDLLWQGLGDIVLLPLQYLLELGFFFLALVWGLKRRNRQIPAAVQMVWISFLIGSLLKSAAAHGNNDLGWRCFMPAQFVALLWAAEMLTTARLGRIAAIVLGIGAVGTVVEIGWQRSFLPLVEARANADAAFAEHVNLTHAWLGDIHDFGKRAYDGRRAYEWVHRTVPAGSRIQHPPSRIGDLLHGLYSQRTALLDGSLSAENLGIASARVSRLQARLERVLTSATPSDWPQVCSEAPAAAWVIRDTDAIWKDRESWVWRRPAAFATAMPLSFSVNHNPADYSEGRKRPIGNQYESRAALRRIRHPHP